MQISGLEKIWRESTPSRRLDGAAVFSLGKRYELDAVVVYDLKISVTGTILEFSDFEVEYVVFDIRIERVAKQVGDNSQAEAIVTQMISQIAKSPESTAINP